MLEIKGSVSERFNNYPKWLMSIVQVVGKGDTIPGRANGQCKNKNKNKKIEGELGTFGGRVAQ